MRRKICGLIGPNATGKPQHRIILTILRMTGPVKVLMLLAGLKKIIDKLFARACRSLISAGRNEFMSGFFEKGKDIVAREIEISDFG